MWRERILGWEPDATFHDGASEAAIRSCEAELGQILPRDPADLLRESDGVQGEYGLGLIWPVDRIRTDNLAFRADAAFVVRDRPTDVFVWDHESDSRTMIKPSLATFLEWWLNGTLTI